jgi:hypothetical protein
LGKLDIYLDKINDVSKYVEDIQVSDIKKLDSFKSLLQKGFREVPVINQMDFYTEKDKKKASGTPIIRIQHINVRDKKIAGDFMFLPSFQFMDNGLIIDVSENNEDDDVYGKLINLHVPRVEIKTAEDLDVSFKYFLRWAAGKTTTTTNKEKNIPIETGFEVDEIKKLKSFGELLRMGLRLVSTEKQLKNNTVALENMRDKNTLYKRTFTITKSGYVTEVIKYYDPDFSSPTPQVLNQRHATYGLAVQTIDDLDDCLKFLIGWLLKHPDRLTKHLERN